MRLATTAAPLLAFAALSLTASPAQASGWSWGGAIRGDLSLSISGSGDVSWRGEAGRLVAAIAGSGDVEVTLGGGALSAAVAGSGDVTWYGEGRVDRSVSTGSGRIVHR